MPDIVYCNDCMYATYWRSGEVAKEYGRGLECSLNIILCPNDWDFCSKGIRQLRCPTCNRRYHVFPNYCSNCGTKLPGENPND